MRDAENPDNRPQAKGDAIPLQVMIGVTGHRRLPDGAKLARRVSEAISEIQRILPRFRSTHVRLGVLSPLAEGADRLVARQVLGIPGSHLEAVLPFEKEDYLRDFESAESRAEFEELLSEARRVTRLDALRTRNESYEQVGRYVVDHCDVLIALWNGKSSTGHGGAADIVKYARDRKRPLFWINTDGFAVKFEPGSGLNPAPEALTRW